MIDAHAHLTDKRYDSADEVVKEFLSEGGEIVVDAGYDKLSSDGAFQNAQKFGCVYFTCGYHPSEAGKDNDFSIFERLLNHEKCVALGEIGLDYHWDYDRESQKPLFYEQMRIAHEAHLPIVVHSRDCSADMLAFLQANKNLLTDGFLMHCYSESKEQAKNYLDLGAHFSFGGVITFKNAKKEDIIGYIPKDRILAETDSPYLTPEPFRGRLNSPAKVRFVYKKLADILQLTYEDTEELTRKNIRSLFKKVSL